jgi:hypothetical protein
MSHHNAKQKSASRGEDCVAGLACAAAVILVGLLLAQPASSNDAEGPEAPITIEWDRDLWSSGGSLRLLPSEGAFRPFVGASGGLASGILESGILESGVLEPRTSELRGISLHPRGSEMLTGVTGGLAIRVATPLSIELSGGWMHDASQLHRGDSEDGFGTALASLKLRF